MASDERSSDEPAAAADETPPASTAPPSSAAPPASVAPSASAPPPGAAPSESQGPPADPPPPSTPFAPAASGPASSDDPFGPLPAGALVGKYEIAGILGQGAFGITYLAKDTQLRREVAVKEYLPTAFAKRQGGSTVVPRSQHTADDFQWGRDRFVDEARTLASLEDAPGIVNVHDFMEANGTAYMVMALVRGETVEARLKRETRLPEAAIAKLLPPLLDGLELVHAAGFLHRDIKPANVLLDSAGRPTLIDFGASRVALEARTQVMTAVYTPGYAPFEQSSSAKQGPWTDVYALCATLYHCVDGSPPPSAIDRMVEDRLKPAAEIGKGRYAPTLLAMIDAGLKLRAPDRPQSIADLRRILKDFGGAGAAHHATAGRPPLGARSTTARGGRTPVLVAAGVTALALIGGGAWFATRPSTELDLATERARRAASEERSRADADAARKAAAGEAERKAAAETSERQRAADEAARKAEAERSAAEEAARRRIAAEIARNAEAQKAAADEEERRRAAAEAERKAALEKAAAEEAERQRVAADAARRAAAEKAAAEEAERQRVAAAEAARKAALEKAAADEAERQRVAAEAARKAAAEKAAAEEAERQRVAAAEAARKAEEEKARALAEARRQGEAAEAALRLTEADRKRVQVALTSLGHNTQGSDGSFGPRSRAMIGAWQKSRNEAETGYLTAPQLAALRTQAAPAIARFDDEQRKLEEDAKRQADEKAKREEEERRRTAAAPPPAAAAPPARPAPAPAEAPQPPRAAAALPPGGVDGAWSGTVDCAPGLRETVTFNIVGGAGIARLAASQGALVLRVAGTNANAQMTWRDAAGVDYEGTAGGVVAGTSIRLQGNARGGGRASTCSVTLTRR